MKSLGNIALAIVMSWCVAIAPADAHRQRVTMTSVDWNEAVGVIEVIHRFHVHDVINGMSLLSLIDSPSLQSVRAHARLALYVEENFLLQSVDATPISLEMVGVQMEGDYILVYQEAPFAARPAALSVQCQFFHDVFKDQTSYVNLRVADETVTHIFENGETLGHAEFSKPDERNHREQ